MSGIGLKTLVLITGAISAVVWLMPGLVTLGFFLFIIPGLILMIMPTVFLYLLAALAIRSILPFGGMGGTALALAIALAIGWLVPQPFRIKERAQYNQALLPEVLPQQPLALEGEVLVVVRKQDPRTVGKPTCDKLCAALLATPGVTGVTLRHESSDGEKWAQARFRLDPALAGQSAGLVPSKPEDIVNHLPRDERKREPGPWKAENDPINRLRKAVISDWALRLSARAGLVEEAEGPAPSLTITVAERIGGGKYPLISRIEVADASGTVALRRSHVTQRLMEMPFHFGFTGSIENARFEVAHTQLSTGPSYPEFDPLRELLVHTALRSALPDPELSTELRAEVVSALDDPAATPARLALARGWMDSLDYTPAEPDLALVNRIIADQRITGIRKQVGRFYSKKVPIELREALVQRIVNPASGDDERRAYAQLLSKLPEGSFARLSRMEYDILADPVMRRAAAPLIERLGDQGEAGRKALMQILEAEIATRAQWAVQQPVIRAVRRGLARLGPAAAPSLPRIEQLFALGNNPLANAAQEADEWRICMARMSKPINDLPFPRNYKPEMIEREKAQIRKRLEEFDPAWESGYSY